MKFLILFCLVTSAYADRTPSSNVPVETIKRLMDLYPGQTEEMIRERLQNTKSTFEKWRAFPPYFYDVVKRSSDIFSPSRTGMCAGDPHLENFGFIYSSRPKFTLNDLDDSSICSQDTDALRLFVGHRLVGKISAADWIQSYKKGQTKKIDDYPHFIKNLEGESQKKKNDLSKKYRKLIESKSCSGDFLPVSDEEKKLLTDYLLKQEKQELKLACARIKETGGSAGLKRFVLFYDLKVGKETTQRAIELKPLGIPAPLAPKVMTLPERQALYNKSVDLFLGREFRKTFFSLTFDGQAYFRRPLWAGNVGVSLDEMSSDDIRDTSIYQAQVLGQYHAQSGKNFNFSPADWESIATKIEEKWRSEMGE